MTKFELSISTNYVPDWGIVEAFRELFQNAIDNETTNPENKMDWNYDGHKITISNKTSKLKAESLLLGGGTKADDENTIGKHGEGYKIAFMVLLRNNKSIKVYNYGAREVWSARLIVSRRYGQQVPAIFVEKEAVWKSVPNNDLTIEVSGITPEEYIAIQDKNLNLRQDTIDRVNITGSGSIILNPEEKGNIYVRGLFISNESSLSYGYDFEPSVITLDRDRRMVSTFNVQWQTSLMWNIAAKMNESLSGRAVKLVNEKAGDTKYVTSNYPYSETKHELFDAVAKDFYEEHGDDAIPVTSNFEYKSVEHLGDGKPVIVSENKASIIRKSSVVEEHTTLEVTSLREKFENFAERIEGKLSDEELNELKELIEQIDW